MLRLSSSTHYLTVTREPKVRRIDIRKNFDDVLSNWTSLSRVSPIISTNDTKVPDLSVNKLRYILFAGPVFPGHLNIEDFSSIFIGLGLFNVIFFAEERKELNRAKKLISKLDAQWEIWTIKGRDIQKISYSSSGNNVVLEINSKSKINFGTALKPALQEYSVLVGTSIGRSKVYSKLIHSDLILFDKIFRKILDSPDLDEIAKQGQLVTANAMLSRHTSQTYSGISPITETECHFWTHSLLGIGIPSLALMRIRQFIEKTFTEYKISQRLFALQKISSYEKCFLSLSGVDEFWDNEHLFQPEIELAINESKEAGEVLPLITCFSGRDGFRSTKLSLSAPLEVITCCNTVSWTLHTITHEITHTIIDGILGLIFPRPESEPDLEKVINSHKKWLQRNKPTTEIFESGFDQLQHYLCYSLILLDLKGSGKCDLDSLANVIRKEWADLNETLTHVFDFLYFYQRDSSYYITAIWASWGVIPNISSRIPAYIVRTLCAVHATNLRKENGVNQTIKEVLNLLEETNKRYPNNLVESAIRELTNQRDLYRTELQFRIPFIKFVKCYLYQPRIAQDLFNDPVSAGGDHEGYSLKSLEFDSSKINNPLRFLIAYCKDTEPNESRASWILHQLAFGE